MANKKRKKANEIPNQKKKTNTKNTKKKVKAYGNLFN